MLAGVTASSGTVPSKEKTHDGPEGVRSVRGNGALMNTMKNRAALVALVLFAVGSVSACGGNPIKNAVDDAVGNAVDKGAEKAIEQAAGGDADVDIDFDGDGASLPDDFPGDVPRPDVKLTAVVKQEDGWFLAYAPTDFATVEALIAEYGSGWETQSETDYGEWKTWAFTNEAYFASVSAVDDGEGWAISLTAVAVTE